MTYPGANGFLIQITSLDELAGFLAILRGQLPDADKIRALTASLTASTADLAAAESAAAATPRSLVARSPLVGEAGETPMAPVPSLDNLAAAVTNATTVNASAAALITGFAARQQAAIDAAIAGGATADQLAPVQAEVDALTASATTLSAAVVANTPAAPS